MEHSLLDELDRGGAAPVALEVWGLCCNLSGSRIARGVGHQAMKVLLLTPYSPLIHHDHAANDLASPLVQALAPLMDLHVYAPSQQNGLLRSWQVEGVTYHAGSPVKRTQLERVGRYPFAARGSWSRQSTREAAALVQWLQPDILHAEYAQAFEPLQLCAGRTRTSITLHDLPGEIVIQPRSEMSYIRRWLQQLERAKFERMKNDMKCNIDGLIVFSERDRDKISSSRGIVEVASVGLNPTTGRWQGDRRHVAVFGGALWRSENEATAIYLAREVIPLVRQHLPDAELRIFGARPTAAVKELDADAGVTVVGEVDDYDDELQRASVTLAPAMVDAGILMKAIRAMAMGCPVVLNSASASPIAGLDPGVHALVGDNPSELAAHIVLLMQDREQARRLGQASMGLVRERFSWERTVEVYCRVFDQLLRART